MTVSPGELHLHPLAERFFLLTPDKVMDAVERALDGRCTGAFTVLNSYENRVYLLPLTDGREIVGKFYRPGRWDADALYDEHELLADLTDEGVPVSAPLILDDGDTIGEVEGIFYALFDRVHGRVPQELTDPELEQLGADIARIHNVGEETDEVSRPPMSMDAYARENWDYLRRGDAMPAELRAGFEAVVPSLIDRMEPLMSDVPRHRIHGDCHLGNLIRSGRGLVFLDFDDMLVGPAVQDIWLLAAGTDDEAVRQRELMVRAYSEERDFDPGWLRLVEPLRALRYLRFASWIARRREDPAFRQAFPYFWDVTWWQNLLMDLREQSERIDRGI